MKKDKVKKEPKKKPLYSLGQNLVFYYKTLFSFKSKVIYMVIAGIPFSILATVISMYTPKIILDLLEFSDVFTEIAFVIIGIFAAKLLCDLVNNGIDAQKQQYDCDTWSYFSILREKKKLSLDYEYLEDPNIQTLNGKSNKAVNNNHTATATLPSTLSGLLINIICFILFGGILSTLNPLIILILMATTFINYLPQKWLRNYSHRTKDEREIESRRLRYFAFLSLNFDIAKDVRLFSMDKHLTEASGMTAKKYKGLLFDLENKSFFVSLVDFVVALLRDGAAYVYLIWRAVEGDISAGDFVLYFSAISSFSSWFSGILSGWSAIHNASLQICDYREYLEIPDKFNHGKGIPLPAVGEPIEIHLKNVSFTYPKAELPTLDNINLTIHDGEKLAIVGLNGAGKTTLVKLICGLYTPTFGKILVNGHEINEYNREEYYSIISAIFQFSSILPITIAENIGVCDKEKIDRTKLDNAVRLSGFGKKIDSLSAGTDTTIDKSINKDGTELSGGEKQRLLLARAIYKNARILILDEPTSALDPIAESEMYRSYNEISENRTSVFISHRLASTRFCDRIILIDGKTIAEQGTHDELIKSGGIYAELFEVQSHYYNESGKEDA
ncbi:MAG: ABC transporter ATP-binding protein [Eubacteriales bacterium]|nr:ABC transporter ATP-binding protein [Eubacteriales bacterium]